MIRARWTAELSGFVVLGALATYVLSSIQDRARLTLVFLVPLAALLVFRALQQVSGNLVPLLKSFTWYHGLWLLVFTSGFVFRIRELGETDVEQALDPWAALRIGLMCLVGLILVARLVVWKTPWVHSMCCGLIGTLTLFGAVCAVSTIWSIFPAWTLYKSVEYLVDVAVLAAILATVCSAKAYGELFDWTWIFHGLVLVSVWVGVLIWPRLALVQSIGVLGVQLQGVLPAESANNVGQLGALLGIVGFTRLLHPSNEKSKSDWAWYCFLLVVGVVTMVFAQTRSAILGFVLGVIVVLLFSKMTPFRVLSALLAGAFLSIQSSSGVLADFMRRGEDEAELQSLSGRLDWWSFAWQKFLEHPLTGYGAFAAGRFMVMNWFRAYGVASVHSDYVEILVGTGLLGILPAVIVFLGTWWILIRALKDPSLQGLDRRLAVEAIGVLSLLSVRSFFTTVLFWHPPLLFLAVLGYAEFLRRRQASGSATVHSHQKTSFPLADAPEHGTP